MPNTTAVRTAQVGAAPLFAGKNIIINGGMDIWQRGTTFTATANLTYLADRWYNSTGTTLNVTRDTDVPTSPYFQYSLKMVGTGDNSIAMRLESANTIPLAGQTITMSFYAKRTSGAGALDVRFYYPSATDNFTSVTQIGSTSVLSASPSSSWTRYQVSVAIGTNITTGLLVLINNTGASTTFITGAQLELGSTATTFSRNASTIQGELAACQRYYYRNTAVTVYSQLLNYAFAYNSSLSAANVQFVVPMRVTPTSIEFSNITFERYDNTKYAVSGILAGNGTPTGIWVYGTASGLTPNDVGRWCANNSTSAYFAFNAEL